MGASGKSGIYVGEKGSINYEPIKGNVTEFENALRTKQIVPTIEHGALYDKDGNPIVGYQGNEHSIPVDERVMQVDGTFTHYHPDEHFGGTLSMADLSVFSKSNLNELRAVSSQGQLYSIKADKNVDRKGLQNWIKVNRKMAQKNFENSYKSALKKATTPLKSGPHKGQIKLTDPKSGKVTYRQPMTPKQAANFARKYSVGMFERMYKKNLSKFGVTYTSTKGGKGTK